MFNLRYAAMNIGGLIGPLLGMKGANQQNLTSYLWLGGLYIIIGVSHFFFFKHYPIVATKQTKSRNKKRMHISKGKHFCSFILLVIGGAFSYFGYAQFNSTVAQYFTNSGKFSNGISYYSFTLTGCQFMVLLFQYLFTRYLSNYIRKHNGSGLIISNLLLATSLLFTIYAYHGISWFCMMISYSLGELLLGSQLDYTVDKLAPRDEKTTYFALTELIKVGSTLGPIVGAYAIRYITFESPEVLFTVLAGITSVGSVVLLSIKNKLN